MRRFSRRRRCGGSVLFSPPLANMVAWYHADDGVIMPNRITGGPEVTQVGTVAATADGWNTGVAANVASLNSGYSADGLAPLVTGDTGFTVVMAFSTPVDASAPWCAYSSLSAASQTLQFTNAGNWTYFRRQAGGSVDPITTFSAGRVIVAHTYRAGGEARNIIAGVAKTKPVFVADRILMVNGFGVLASLPIGAPSWMPNGRAVREFWFASCSCSDSDLQNAYDVMLARNPV